MNKRHAKPTTAQFAARTYRKVIGLEHAMARLEAALTGEMRSGQQMLSQRMESLREGSEATMKTLADHCSRLLREKETLMKMRQANTFMADAPRDFTTADMSVKCYEHPVARAAGWGCGFKLLHRVGVRCAVCGELEMPNAFQEGHNNDAH